ncbi:hypothetical protein EMIHUDRAFT_194610 [Emiliania huxleyi CCMP1516]|uniref:EamA domain-containing protein n=2 Tax=Emiliania huxleyi TaxID=2903 RepID=A0A0D3L1T8_EMIH1|nr:hypothetical protein EMIHUDRAFT_194610 [Emiliania huxleyi CCMP1516]EOD41973.1 hypothetical protein EMIHUDRAFT_194610 [Emiliania huxleyi CCMP1516]|eukprot:XP_005794402.1 hypothetical protein EMIHUDRAFT_194610 [Emiliania huxleyi CCMP1516]
MRLPAPALAPAWHAANVLARSGSVASSEVRLDDADSALDLQTLSFLVGAAALWGTYPTCVKLLYSAGPPLDPSIVVLLRFIIMAAVSCSALFATTPRFTLLRRYVTAAEAASMAWSEQLERRVPASVYALELGILGGLGTFLQTLSLSQIPALTAAVLYSTVNVITPALAALAGANAQEREVSARTWAGCALGLIASCWALVPDVGLLPQSLPASVGGGEGTMLAASFCYAASKVRLSSHLRHHPPDDIAVGRLVGQAGCAAAFLGLVDKTQAAGGLAEPADAVLAELVTWANGLLLASSLLSGAGATWFQSNGQRKASAPKAQLWFAMTPVFGAVWAYLILGEALTYHECTGAALVVGAIKKGKVRENEKHKTRKRKKSSVPILVFRV